MLSRFIPALSLLALLISLGLPTVTSAQEAEGKNQEAEGNKPDFAAAKQHFKAGQGYMQAEQYADAVEQFTKAYEITGDGLVMGQVALAYEKAGDYEAALMAIKVYREALPPAERGSADALADKYRQLISAGKSKKLVLPSEQAEQAPVEPPVAAEQAPADSEPLVPEPEETEGGKGRFYTWIAAGTAGALALSALVVGLNAQSEYNELSDNCKPTCSDSEVDSVKTRALVTDILWGAAAAAAITAGVLFFVEKPAQEERPEMLEEEETDLYSRIRVSPVMGRGSYGVGAGISF